MPYFNKQNFVEVYALLSTENSAKEWNKKLNKTPTNQEIVKVKDFKTNNEIEPLHQLYWLCKRYIDIKLSNKKNLAILFIQPVLIALLLKLAFDHLIEEKLGFKTGVTSAIFMMAIAAVWFGISNSAKEIVGEKAIYKRERMYNLILGNYFLSKWLVLTLISFFQILVFLGLLNFLYSGELTNFFPTLGFLFLVSTSSIIFGLLLSAISQSTEEVMSILPLALLPQIIL